MSETEIQKIEDKIVNLHRIVQPWLESRKAMLLLLTFTIATVAFFMKLLNGDQWITLVKWAVPAYMVANVGESAAQAFAGIPKSS